MVAMDLSELRIRQGRELIEALDRTGELTVGAALWLYLGEIDCWRLVLEIQEADALGKAEVHRRIQAVLADRAAGDGATAKLRSLDVTVAETNSPEAATLSSLRALVRTGGGLHGVRLTNTVIQARVIEDVLIYRT